MLVNNAGISGRGGGVGEASDDEWDGVIDTPMTAARIRDDAAVVGAGRRVGLSHRTD